MSDPIWRKRVVLGGRPYAGSCKRAHPRDSAVHPPSRSEAEQAGGVSGKVGPDVAKRQLQDRAPRPFHIDDEVIDVRVRESARSRHTRIIVGARRPLEVIVPSGAKDVDIDRFLEEKRRWIERNVAAAREIAAGSARLGLQGAIWLAGERLAVARCDGERSLAVVSDRRLVVSGPDEGTAGAIERWYRREARTRIEAVAGREAPRLAVEYRSIGIRDQRTRWGSCSRRGNLSFSWRLIVAPQEVLEYVVVHELCHLREHNHAKAFWRLLTASRPSWQAEARWLREHGLELHEYRPCLDSGG